MTKVGCVHVHYGQYQTGQFLPTFNIAEKLGRSTFHSSRGQKEHKATRARKFTGNASTIQDRDSNSAADDRNIYSVNVYARELAYSAY